MKRASYQFIFAIWLALANGIAATNAAEKLGVTVAFDPNKAIPISVTGYTGEVASVLKFDLEVAGFTYVDSATAEYSLSNGDGTRVEGRLFNRAKANLLAKAYAGGSARTQAHALADDVVKAILKINGI